MATFDEQLLKAAETAFANNPSLQSYGRVVDGQYQSVTRPSSSRVVDPNAPISTRIINPNPGLVSKRTVGAVTPAQRADVGAFDSAGRGTPLGSPVGRRMVGALGAEAAADAGSLDTMRSRQPDVPTSRYMAGALDGMAAADAGSLDAMRRSMPSDPDRFGLYGSPATPFADADAGSLDTMRRTSPAGTPATPSGPTMAELDSRAFDAAMQDAADGNLGAIEEAFWGITNAELGGTTEQKTERKTGEKTEEETEEEGGSYGFGDQAALIQEQLGGLQTADLTAKITSLIDEARKGARSLNAETVRQIAAGYNLQEKQIEAIAKAATETVKQTENMRTAAIDTLVADAATRVDQMVADQAANVASGTALAGPNQLTTEFAEVVTLTNALVNSVAVGAKSSMSRIQAVANIAAAQRMAAPALMMADAKNALGAERFALEGQAQMALEKTLNSLNVQEKEMIFNEALRIEQFNNNRDMALAQALINNGMAKLQYTIEEQRRDEDYSRRQAELMQQRADAAAAAQESRRRFELEFGLKQSQEARLQEAQDADTLAALQGESDDMGRAVAVAQQIYGPNATQAQIRTVSQLSAAQQNTLLGDALSKNPSAGLKPGTFESLVAEGFDEGVAQNAVTWVTQDRKIQKLEADLANVYGVDIAKANENMADKEDVVFEDVIKNQDLSGSQAQRAAMALEQYVDLSDKNAQMMTDYDKELETLTGASARKMNFKGAVDRINATTVFALDAPLFDDEQNLFIPNPGQAGSMNPNRINWDSYTPMTTYLDTGRRAWLGS